MEARRCGTCLHYDPAPSWRKGWCRNSILFSSRQSHLVQDDELDCSRGTGDFWEAKRGQPDSRSEIAGQANVRLPKLSPLKLFAPASPEPALAEIGGTTMFASDSDDGEYGPSGGDDGRPGRSQGGGGSRMPRGGSSGGGRQRTVQFQPEERYWTEYLRIALPIIGLLLMIGLFWFWAQQLINDSGNTDTSPTRTPVGVAAITDESTPEPTNPPVVGNDAAEQTPAPTTEPADSTPPVDPPTEESAADGNPDTNAAEEEAASELAVDGNAVISEDGVNLRPDATTEGEPLTTLNADTAVTILDGPVDADGYTWWQVVVDDDTAQTGWVVQDYLEPAP